MTDFRWEKRVKKFCGDEGNFCPYHFRPCKISLQFKRGDSRNKRMKKAVKISGYQHDSKSNHLCDLCFQEMSERREFGWYQVDPIDGRVKPPHQMGKLIPEQHG